MADIKWSAFPSVGASVPSDTTVGLRAGANVRFNPASIPFVVGANGPYTTIQSAINAAALVATVTVPAIVLVNGGTYTENLTLKSFVNLCNYGGVTEKTVNVIGNTVFTAINPGDIYSSSGITHTTPGGGGIAFSVAGAVACTVFINSCYYYGLTGTAFSCTNTNAVINKSDGQIEASAGQKCYDMTGGIMNLTAGYTQATDTSSTFSGSSFCKFVGSYLGDSFVTSGTATIAVVSSALIAPTTLVAFTLGSTSFGVVINTTVLSNSAGGYWAAGTGALAYNAVTPSVGSAILIDPALTIVNQTLQVGSLTAASSVTAVAAITATAGIVTSGASTGGFAGQFQAFSTTSSLGSTSLTAANNAGNFANVLTNASTAAARTWTLPDATGTIALTSGASGIVNSGTQNQLTWYAATGTTVSGLATANNGILVTSAGGVPSIGNAILADISINGVNVGKGGGSVAGNTRVGVSALNGNTSGNATTALGLNAGLLSNADYGTYIGYVTGSTVTSGNWNTLIGGGAGGANGIGADLTTGNSNTILGQGATVNNSATIGSLALGREAIGLIATGATSADIGPSVSIGSTQFPVGVRGDGSIYPSTTGAGFWRPVINGTAYLVPLIASGSTAWPAITTASITFSTTSGIIGTTTNDNAAAGSVGEVVTSTVAIGSPVAMTDNTNMNVTSISLTAGDWDVFGNVKAVTSGAVTVFYLNTWIGLTSATQNTDNTQVGIVQYGTGGLLLADTVIGIAPTTQRISLASTTTVYLGAVSHFTGGTSQSAYGTITARRRR